jgi:hypothetical protein
MIEIEQMSFSEKLRDAQRQEKVIWSYTVPLVREELGKEKVAELKALWQKGSQPIPIDGTDEEKYDVAYENFLRTWVIAHDFMARYQGDAGKAKFMRTAINGWKRQYTPRTLLAKVMMTVAPKMSFQTVAKSLAYRLQVFSPFTVDQLDKQQMVLTLAPCKIASTNNDFCRIACQNVIRAWLEAQFNIKMVSTVQGINCVVKIVPFNA